MVATRRGGQRSDEQNQLSREQELELIDVLRGSYPDGFGLDDELWSRQSLGSMIQLRYGLAMDQADVGGYMRAWGLRVREPHERACGLCVDSVATWLADDYPAITRSAQEHHADVYWIGRTRLHGVVPAADVLSAVSTRGRIRFMIATPSVDPPLPRDFLLRLSGEVGRTVHVIVDGSWPSVSWPRRLPPRVVLHPLPSCGRGL